jgi:hypothetical protein
MKFEGCHLHPSQRKLADKTKSWPDQKKNYTYVQYCSYNFFYLRHTPQINWLFKATWMQAASQCCQMDMRLIAFDDFSKYKCVAEFVNSKGN